MEWECVPWFAPVVENDVAHGFLSDWVCYFRLYCLIEGCDIVVEYFLHGSFCAVGDGDVYVVVGQGLVEVVVDSEAVDYCLWELWVL